MSKDEAISIALDSISKIRKFLEAADDLENRLKKITNKKHLLKNSKQFIDDLYTISDKIKTNFYAQYDELEKEVENDSEDDGILDNSKQNIENSTVENSENVTDKDASEEDLNTINNASSEENSINEANSEPKISDSDDVDVKATFSKSIIRVVDLNKLIDPKQKKSVKFDSSVIILTSSDEEDAPPVSPKLKENGLKSSIKISSDRRSRNINIFEPEVNIEEIKENSSPDNSRKSSRLRNVQIKRETKRDDLKKIFKRSSDKNFEIISKRSKRNCDNSKDTKRNKVESSSEEKDHIVADSSSGESDTERSKSHGRAKNLSRKCKISDQKFKSKVYVPLPLIQCHKLKEVYKTDKDIFACSSGTRSSKRIRRSSGYESDNESSKNKKTRTREDKIADEHKSYDERFIKDDLENVDTEEVNAEKPKKKENKKGSRTEAAKSKKDKSEIETGEGTDKDEDDDKTDEDETKTKINKEKTVEITNAIEEKFKEKEDATNIHNKVDENDRWEEDEGKKTDVDQDGDNKEISKKKEGSKNKKKTNDASDETVKENSGAKTDETDEGRKSRNKIKSSGKKRESDEETSTEKAINEKKKTKSKSDDEGADSGEGSEKKTEGGISRNKTKLSDKDGENEEENAANKSELNESDHTDEEGSEEKQKGRNRTKNDDKDRESNVDDDSTNKGRTEAKTSDDERPEMLNEDNEDVKNLCATKASERDSEDEAKEKNIKNIKNKTEESEGEDEDHNKENSGSEDRNKVDDDNTEKEPVRKTKKKPHKLVDLSNSDDDEKEKRRSSDDEKETDGSDRRKTKKTTKKRIKKAVVSDSDDERDGDKKFAYEATSDSSSDGDADRNKSDSDEERPKKKPKRKSRIKRSKNSSSDSEEEVATRKQIRRVLDKDSLSETTKKAEEEEKERKSRIAEKQKKYNRMFEEKKDATVESVVLDYHNKTKEPRISVHKKIVKNLKPHQVSGIQFMYDACFESVERTMKSPGSGCILAHCMGLGKTLQVVALTHTLLKQSDLTKVERVMVVCPINTVLNWKAEYQKWVPKKSEVGVYELATSKKNYERQYIIKEWYEDGGVLIIGYTMFRNLSNPANKRLTKKMRTDFHDGLVDPGPDLVICDEGHLLKNEKTHLSIAMNRIKTARRIVLTGTPLQNNLKEYWCMVQFIKPNLLGTYKEYMNRFVNPITNGQYTDSTQHDIVLMRKRSHVLHKLLDGVVQRRDYSVLEPYLPTKHEYVLFVKLSDTQIKIYKHYMDKLAKKNDGSNRTSFLFTDFQQLQRICTHPRVLADKTKEKKEKWDDEDDESEGSLKDFIDDNEDSASNSSSDSSSNVSDVSSESVKKKKKARTRVTRAVAAQRKENNEEDSDIEMISETKKEWWQEYCDGDELDNIANSGKLSLFFEILKECEEIGDKVLVFSQSLYTLNCIEYFLGKIDEATSNNDTEKLGGYKGTWELGLDYFRLDGSSSCDNRAYWCDSFNNPDNERSRLFLISTRAGGLGINLVAANRVVIFDVSWNPSHDLQSIYRVYRFGQTKPCYVYRFVTYGAMEMKIYERQVTKQAISKRVIDEQQIDRHYNQHDLQELYQCDLDPEERPIPLVPKDVLLAEMLQKYDKILYKYHLHQSLLENKHEEGLNEEERKAAWDEFENEKVLRKTTMNASTYLVNSANMSAQAINAALTNIVKRDNPNWSEAQIKGIIPALVRQLQIQIEENDMSMYQRVVQEIQIMNQAKLKESYYQQQMMKYYQQQMLIQKRQQALLGNLNINPVQIQNMFGANANYMNGAAAAANFPNNPSTSAQNRLPNDVIELND